MINCHFGTLPNYTKFFVKSASTIECMNFHIMNDDVESVNSMNDFCAEIGASNVSFHYLSIQDLESTIQEKLDAENYKMPSIRKICDWKTAYGFLFGTFGCDWWGHCDLDIIWGDVDKYLSDMLESDVDIISADKTRLCGPCNIYRTSQTEVFKAHTNWRKLLLEQDHVAYDEIGLDRAIKLRYDLSVVYGRSHGQLMQNYGSPHLAPPVRIPATWTNGRLTIDEDLSLIHI